MPEPDDLRSVGFLGLGIMGSRMAARLAGAGFPPSRQGNRETAASLRKVVAAKMTETQIAEAERLAREWKPRANHARR